MLILLQHIRNQAKIKQPAIQQTNKSFAVPHFLLKIVTHILLQYS